MHIPGPTLFSTGSPSGLIPGGIAGGVLVGVIGPGCVGGVGVIGPIVGPGIAGGIGGDAGDVGV